MFTCVLNSSIKSDNVQWYRFIRDTSTAKMVDSNGTNINITTDQGRQSRSGRSGNCRINNFGELENFSYV